jgi:hypothetical protein
VDDVQVPAWRVVIAGQEAAQGFVPGWHAGDFARARRGAATMPAELDRKPEPGEKWCVISFHLLEMHMAW